MIGDSFNSKRTECGKISTSLNATDILFPHPAPTSQSESGGNVYSTQRPNQETPSPVELSAMQSGKNRLRLVFWETTSACNLECVHCRRIDVAAELAKQDLSTEQGLALISS